MNSEPKHLGNGQLILLEAESDAALLMPRERRAKIFTAAQVRKIEEREEMILMLIASAAFSLEEIARRCHIGDYTIRELIARKAQAIAGDMERSAEWADGISAAFLALAYEKVRQDYAKIPMKDLVAAHSFTGKLALERRLAAQGLKGMGTDGAVVDVTEESPALLAARAEAQRIWDEEATAKNTANTENGKAVEV